MNTATEALLRELEESAAAQLSAARTLDAEGLQTATERRHAAVTALSTGPRPEPEILAASVQRVRQLDVRLVRILKSADRTFQRILHPTGRTYDRSGRLREVRT